jgi:hypothetical protein
MKPETKFIYRMDYRVKGIPCIIAVSYFHCQPRWKGGAHTCDSDWDYYGYTDIDYEVLDRRGHKAPWLERMIDKDLDVEIKIVIDELMTGELDDEY